MNYDEIAKQAHTLSYRDKLRLAQLLIQLARKEEEQDSAKESQRQAALSERDHVQYVAHRLKKLRPASRKTLLNAIGAMFQFQGGITEAAKADLVRQLQEKRIVTIDPDGRVLHPDAVVA